MCSPFTRFIEAEIAKEEIEVANCSFEEVDAPSQRESLEMENSVNVLEENIREVGDNFAALMCVRDTINQHTELLKTDEHQEK